MKKSNDTIGNRTRYLPACSAVPQPTALPRAPIYIYIYIYIYIRYISLSSLLFSLCFYIFLFYIISFTLCYCVSFCSHSVFVCLFVFTFLCLVGTEQREGPETRQRLMRDLEPEPSDYRVRALFWWFMRRHRGVREVASRLGLGFVQQINCRLCAIEPATICNSISLLNGS